MKTLLVIICIALTATAQTYRSQSRDCPAYKSASDIPQVTSFTVTAAPLVRHRKYRKARRVRKVR